MTHPNQFYMENIRNTRLQKGWSQKKLADKASLTQSHISQIEKGEVDIRLSSLIELARALELELMFVPRTAIPTVKAILHQHLSKNSSSKQQAYILEDEDGV